MKKSVFYNKYLETNYIDHPKKELCDYLIGLKRGIRTSFSVLKKSFLRRTLFLKVTDLLFKENFVVRFQGTE